MSLRRFDNFHLSIRILIAERFLETQARLEKLFSETDDIISVGTATKGELAISMVGKLQPDIVLLGIDLPGGALTTIKKIRQLFPTVQVIVLGYAGQTDDKERVTKTGASAYLEIPFSDETLLSLIRSLNQTKPHPPSLLRRMEGQPQGYADLRQRILQSLEEQEIKQNFRRLLVETFERILAQERIVLSRPERNRLFKDTAKQFLQEMMDSLENKSS